MALMVKISLFNRRLARIYVDSISTACPELAEGLNCSNLSRSAEYRVKAINKSGQGRPSNTISVVL